MVRFMRECSLRTMSTRVWKDLSKGTSLAVMQLEHRPQPVPQIFCSQESGIGHEIPASTSQCKWELLLAKES